MFVYRRLVPRLAALTVLLLGVAGGVVRSGPAAAHDHPLPLGARVLSIDVSEAEAGGYDAAFQLAREAGMEEDGLVFHWNELEPAPGVYDDTYPDIANLYFPLMETPLNLALAPISTNQDVRPADLVGLAWDDPLLIERYLAWIDHVLSRMPEVELTAIIVGMEVDALLGTDPAAWRAYAGLVAAATERIEARLPQTRLAVEVLFDGLTDDRRPFIETINKQTDLIAVSYYPLEADFGVRPPEAVHDDMELVTELFPGRTIWFTQLGYPASGLLGSSEAMQAEFVRETILAWDHHADQVELICFVWLHDQSPEAVASFEEFYGLHDVRFAAFLGSLGLRTYPGDGEARPAWVVLQEEANARGW
jgi:hypothetical protein